MTADLQTLRIDGIYRQNDNNDLMLRIKIPGGLLSPVQAEAIAALSERFSNHLLHLTSRGSIELHWLRPESVEEVGRQLAAVGLTSRGACGGAVRGISCSTTVAPGFSITQGLARRLHRHFSGNPHFEGLPKKFKISVDAGYSGARHLIQDAGIVHVATTEAGELYDLWVAGGLGREPQPAFLFARQLSEGQLLAHLEAIIHLYRQHTPAGKRLKHLLRDIGEESFRELLALEAISEVALQPSRGLGCNLKIEAEESVIEARIFAGQVSSSDFRHLAELARRYGNEQLLVTADQNFLLFPAGHSAAMRLRQELAQLGFAGERRDEQVNFRICPGNHECRMGLAPTRVIAREILDGLPNAGLGLTYAISGCSNSCSQPQLADVGIITTALRASGEGERQPRFALYRRHGASFGTVIAADLTAEELLAQLSRIV
ncbi:MAG: nitrite reductase [Deltaproteobacteria bacterium HGW-Deltaproteobacteria-4]|nr:MAG: nitrite reductase [Deltaproteobacteria bacterium HGW-Deltaproteobacteria-4]